MKIMKIVQTGGVSHEKRGKGGSGEGGNGVHEPKRAATLDKFKQMAGGSP